MAKFDTYRETFPNARLSRQPNGVLEVALHTDGGKLLFNGHTHEQFVHLFHAIGEDHHNRVVILTGSGDAFMDAISPEGFDFFSPQGYDKILREGRKVLSNILDIEVPMISALNGPVLLHSEYALLTDIILATPQTVFQDKPHFEFGIVPGGGVNEIVPADRLLARAHEIADGIAALPPLTSRYTRIALTQKLRRIIDEGSGYSLALEGISAADVARAAAQNHRARSA